MDIRWSGEGFIGSPVDVDFVIALDDATTGEVTPLFTTTVSKPNPGDTIGDFVTIEVGLQGIEIGVEDSIIISHRAHDRSGTNGRWIPLVDDLTMTVVPIPAPGAMALLALTGLTATRRRR